MREEGKRGRTKEEGKSEEEKGEEGGGENVTKKLQRKIELHNFGTYFT